MMVVEWRGASRAGGGPCLITSFARRLGHADNLHAAKFGRAHGY